MFILSELARSCGGQVTGDPKTTLNGVSTDTRAIEPGALFVALIGENFDGHDFAAQAASAGAAAVLVSRPVAVDVPQLLVRDTLCALGEIARGHRARFNGPVLAITGSNGKTTAREMTAAILEAAGLRVRQTHGNLNNLIGLPLSVLKVNEDDEVLVVEMGMNQPGELDRLAEIAAPTVGAVTNVAPAHLGPMGSIEAIAEAKGELFARLGPHGIGIVNADDAHCRAQAPRCEGRTVTFGRAVGAQFRADALQSGVRASFDLHTPEGTTHVALGAPGPHLFENALCAAACAHASGLLGDGALDAIRDGLANFRGVRGRLALCETRSGLTILDDSYNANPHSVAAGLRTLTEMRGAGRAIAVLGDMLELGPDEAELHADVGRLAAAEGVDLLIGVGARSANTCVGAREAGLSEAISVADAEEALEELNARARARDVILVKGSRAMKLERVVDALVDRA